MAINTSIFAILLSFLLYSSSSSAAVDSIFLDCGASSNQPSQDRRAWQTDSPSNYIPSNANQISEPSSADYQNPSLPDKIPYITARLIYSEFTYTFSTLSIGSKFLRLYFYPSTYPNKNNKKTDEAFFSVKANQYTLLSNFSPILNLPQQDKENPPSFFIKEYIIHISEQNQALNLTFLPNENSFSFVNGIELVSIPDTFYNPGDRAPIQIVPTASSHFYKLGNVTALETMYRLNVGGTYIAPSEDTGMMFRKWTSDDEYVHEGMTTADNDAPVKYTSSAPEYSAPKLVYTSARFMDDQYSHLSNLTWLFPVDSGHFYLLRLYFCEFFDDIKQFNDRVFSIYINNMTAEKNADVIGWGGYEPKVAVFRDYVVYVQDIDGQKRKQDLRLSMHPSLERDPVFANVLLNGLEIFKLTSQSLNSLAAPNPPPFVHQTKPEVQQVKKKRGQSHWEVIVGVLCGVGVAALVVILLGFLIFRAKWSGRVRKQYVFDKTDKSRSSKNGGISGSSLPNHLCKNFSIEEILSATGNFDESVLIGVGGFGNVYKGCINGEKIVAIKRLNPSSAQGEVEFLTEIKMLSKLRHVNLVPLIGYCVDNGEMILVYDYMARGNLREHLYKSENSHLPWKQRLQICIGAAKGLDYLHTSASHKIIHRDVKSTNILLDENWVAKVSDFGLSKIGPIIDGDKLHVSTAVKGSIGYVDPEYFRRKQLTDKSDVYSFGVVLFEVLCGRPAIIPFSSTMAKEEVNLAAWANLCYKKGTIDQIVDPKLKGQISGDESLNRFVETALKCLNKVGTERPTMNDVVWSLQFALELQESSEKKMNEDEEVTNPCAPLVLHGDNYHATTPEDDSLDIFSRSLELASSYSMSKSSDDFTASSDRFKSQNVFSEIMKPSAR